MKPTDRSIELLEARIAPATLVNPKLVTFQDVDGDTVSIAVSKPIFDAATIDSVLKFSTGIVNASNAAPQQLQAIVLTALADLSKAAGTSIAITAKRGTAGDGFVNVGLINASGIDLGAVKLDGDLGRILAGNSEAPAPGVVSLTVQSIGELGTSTQSSGDLASVITGGIGSLAVKNNFREAQFVVTEGIGKLTIGGSLIAASTSGSAIISSGFISANGKIGPVLVKGNIVGGGLVNSGSIASADSIASLSVGGSIFGGGAEGSGRVTAGKGIGTVFVKGDLVGGVGDHSGFIDGTTGLGAVTIRGSMIGGGGAESGSLVAQNFQANIKSVTIGGDIRGGAGEESAYIHSDFTMGPVKITGSVIGGSGQASGVIYAGNAVSVTSFTTSITVGGSVVGGSGPGSGTLGNAGFSLGGALSLDIGIVSIKGSLVGGAAANSGTIIANDFQSVTVGSVVGNTGVGSGYINATGTLAKLIVKGSIVGGAGDSSGSVTASALGTAQIAGDLRSAASFSGRIAAGLAGAKAITIGGSIFSGTGFTSGAVDINGPLGSLLIGGSVIGTSANPAFILVRGTDSAATPSLGKLTIKGSAHFAQVLGGYSIDASVPNNADAIIGPVSVGGDWVASSIASGIRPGGDGKFGTLDDLPGQFSNNAVASRIASITIKGQLLGTVGGTDGFGFSAEEIGTIKIGKVTYPALELATPLALGATGDFFAKAGFPV